jgi:hypothetical protein
MSDVHKISILLINPPFEANMPLEFVVNVLDDATHVELDIKILHSKLTQRLQKLSILRSFQRFQLGILTLFSLSGFHQDIWSNCLELPTTVI